MVKIVFSDIDGTLLTDDKQLTPNTKQAVQLLGKNNIPFVLVSARMPEAIYPITENMGITIPLICYSGALVLDKMGKVLASTTMTAAVTAEFIAVAARNFPAATINYYAGHHWYVKDITSPPVVLEMNITGATAENADFGECLQKNILPNKLLLMMDPADCEQAEKELQARFPKLNVVRSAPHLLEVMNAMVNKASGIEVMLKHYGFSAKDALSFGDNYNDLEMLSYTGTSVAMGNAPQKVKVAASAVTLPNEEDGIYVYLKKNNLLAK